MAALALPAFFALFVWWFSTAAILFLDGLPRSSFRWSMAGATAVLAGAVYELMVSRTDASATGAYVAFTSGLLIWAWLEMTYYMGFVTGPRRQACAPGCAGWRHFGHAVMSSLYHELATIGLAAALYAATRGMPNQVALWTFVVLWGMQISAKLNVFLGVPNVSEEFLPEHLSFLKGFLTKKPMNFLFPLSVTASVVLATLLVQRAFSASAGGFEATAYDMLAMLTVLAVVEHWFLVVPIRAEVLWRWSLVSRDKTAQSEPDAMDSVETRPQSSTCMHQARATQPMARRPGKTRLDRPIYGTALGECLSDALHLQPAQPSLARRQR